MTQHTLKPIQAKIETIRLASVAYPYLSAIGPEIMATMQSPVPTSNQCHHSKFEPLTFISR
jgi:hypothetical protein